MVLGVLRVVLCGARRSVMTGKRGNKNFYKGRGARSAGRHTRKGGYVIMEHKISDIVVPALEGFQLKPYVSYKTPYVVGKPLLVTDILDLVREDTRAEQLHPSAEQPHPSS